MTIEPRLPTSPQDAFDLSVRGILSQGGPSGSIDYNEFGQPEDMHCRFYDTDRDRHCAVGWWIPGDKYHARYDLGTSLPTLLRGLAIPPTITPAFASDLQETHDTAAEIAAKAAPVDEDAMDRLFLREFKRRARAFAKLYDLNPAVLDEELPQDHE